MIGMNFVSLAVLAAAASAQVEFTYDTNVLPQAAWDTVTTATPNQCGSTVRQSPIDLPEVEPSGVPANTVQCPSEEPPAFSPGTCTFAQLTYEVRPAEVQIIYPTDGSCVLPQVVIGGITLQAIQVRDGALSNRERRCKAPLVQDTIAKFCRVLTSLSLSLLLSPHHGRWRPLW
eukprot:scaffold602_cov298-Pinguiococcus_pyrenoidosus.AAC.36